MRLATISTTWQNRPACKDSRSGLRGTSASELFAKDLRSLHHRLQFCKSHFLRQVQATAIGKNMDALGRHKLKSFAQPLGNNFRRFNLMRLHIDGSDAKLKLVGKLLEQLKIFDA